MKYKLGILMMICLASRSFLHAAEYQKDADKPIYVSVTATNPVSPNDSTRKIIDRNTLEREGSWLASSGRYEEAIAKFESALDPRLLNYSYEGATARGLIIIAYQRMGDFDMALKKHREQVFGQKDLGNFALDRQMELEALIRSRDTGSQEPVYDHIQYLRKKYKKSLPPKGFVAGFTGGVVSSIIHLYDHMGDADSAIKFMDEVINYRKKTTKGGFANSQDIAEYERVKHAFELDKQTGQKHHLRDVIKDSNFIGW